MQTLPVIPLRGVVVLPGEVIHCDAGRKKTLMAMQAAASNDGLAFFCTQKDAQKGEITFDDLPIVGTICRIRQVFRIHGEGLHMLVTGISRAEVKSYTSDTPYFEAYVDETLEYHCDTLTTQALKRRILRDLETWTKLDGKISSDQKQEIIAMEDAAKLAYAVAALLITDTQKKQQILEEQNPLERLFLLTTLLSNEVELQRMDKELSQKVQERVEKHQKEYYLREKLKVIHEELGDLDAQDADVFLERMEEKVFPEEVKQRLEKEIRRLRSLPSGSHELPMATAYIECLLELPWSERTEDNYSIENARSVLDRDHYGMEKIKERILEYLAVRQLREKPTGQILCLVGPPGVGKTSIAAGIAEAIGRKFVRMSLGGIRDEAEIRGHRRTYIGAMPGRIINAMRQAGTMNPVLLFDEIDKLGSDYKGDPTAAMLEVLDSAQNFAFRDHFLELPYDLSQAMIITTANDAQAIPKPLLDRMEIIQVPSYLEQEKLEIAKRHLLHRQMEANGLKRSMLRITDAQLRTVILSYTREAGVRELERKLGTLCRKAAKEIVEGKKRIAIGPQKLIEYLGQPQYNRIEVLKSNTVGLVNGLAWTAVGGETLSIEAQVTVGTGNLQLTGQLGDVMQESGKAALTYIRSNYAKLGLKADFYQNKDVHIHVPEGAIPKDGPSAGVTMATALASAFCRIPVKGDLAMTGEITLRGRVLPIGGVREKLTAAIRSGITSVILPEDNRKDFSEVPASIQNAVNVSFVSDLSQVFELALMQGTEHIEERKDDVLVYPAQTVPGIICRD